MTLASVLQMDERQHDNHHSRCLASCGSKCWVSAAAQTLQAYTGSRSLILGISYIHIFSQASWHALRGGADAVCLLQVIRVDTSSSVNGGHCSMCHLCSLNNCIMLGALLPWYKHVQAWLDCMFELCLYWAEHAYKQQPRPQFHDGHRNLWHEKEQHGHA